MSRGLRPDQKDGFPAFPRVNVAQALFNRWDRPVWWRAVVVDPETGKRLNSVRIFMSEPFTAVELALEREPYDGIDPQVRS